MSSKQRALLTIAISVLTLVVLTVIAKAVGQLDWFIAFATVGTALGTLGLALYTYRLAQSTRESVEGSSELTKLAYAQLGEVQSQRDLLAEQAEKAGLQAEATRRLADASETSATEAAKARIDAIAPLVHMTISSGSVRVKHGPAEASRYLQQSDEWYEPQLRGLSFQVSLPFRLHNVGVSPARVAFDYTAERLEYAARRGLAPQVLEPGDSYEDQLLLHFAGVEAKDSKLIALSVTYEGLLHGEMFDHIQWKGWVAPLKQGDGTWVPNDERWLVNSGGASVIRSYPNLERPAEMAEARARLLDPQA